MNNGILSTVVSVVNICKEEVTVFSRP